MTRFVLHPFPAYTVNPFFVLVVEYQTVILILNDDYLDHALKPFECH
jgi:hypothetical protein